MVYIIRISEREPMTKKLFLLFSFFLVVLFFESGILPAMADTPTRKDTFAHQVLTLESELGIKPPYDVLDDIIKKAKERIPQYRRRTREEARDALQAIDDVLLTKRIIYKGGIELLSDSLKPHVLDKETMLYVQLYDPEEKSDEDILDEIEQGKIILNLRQKDFILAYPETPCYFADCDTLCFLYLGIADAVGLPLRAVKTPGHIFIRWHFSEGDYLNWETTSASSIPDEKYLEKMTGREKAKGRYMKSMEAGRVLGYVQGNIAVRLEMLGRREIALKFANQAIKLNPECLPAWNIRGVIRQRQGDLHGSLDDLNGAIALDPDFSEAYINRGVALAKMGQLTGALEDYNRALQIQPSSKTALINRGVALSELGKYDHALKDIDAALKIDPDFSGAHANRGIVLNQAGRYQSSVESFTRAIRLDPGNANLYIHRGQTRMETEDWNGAISDFDKALEIDARLEEAYAARAFCHLKKQQWREARRDYDRAIFLNPRESEYYHNRGVALQGMKLYDMAKKDFEKAQNL